MNHVGSCPCGKVAFEIEGEFDRFYLCHCERCRKDRGSAHAANMFSSTATLRWLSGEDLVKTFDFNGTGHTRSFCTVCGSALPNIRKGGMLVVPAGSLDCDAPLPPSAHIFVSHQADWDKGLEKIPAFGGLPE